MTKEAFYITSRYRYIDGGLVGTKFTPDLANPNFNVDRWMDYIAGECGPNGGKRP